MGVTVSDKPIEAAAQQFCLAHIAPHADRWDAEEALPDSLLADLARMGWRVPTMPRDMGGGGLDNWAHAGLAEAIGGACQSVRNFMAVQGMVAHAILRWGDSSLARVWPERIAQGDALGAFALTESQGGSNARRVETSIEVEGDTLLLKGRKCWISFAQRADILLVIGHIGPDEMGAVLVEPQTEGVEIEPVSGLLGFRASSLGHITFRQCRIGADSLVARGPFLFQTLVTGALDYGRFSTASGCVGLSQACLDLARDFARSEARSGEGLDRYQSVRNKIADMMVDTQASRLMVQHTARLRDANAPEAVPATLAAKYFASTRATKVASDAVQLHGAIGVSKACAVQRHFRDSKINEIIEGASDVLRNEIARLR